MADMEIADDEWPEGWCGLTEDQQVVFLAQLRRELPRDHPFQHLEIEAIGTATGSDDVVYWSRGWQAPYFVSHLSWRAPDRRPALLRWLRPRPGWSPGIVPLHRLDDLAGWFD